MKMYLSLVYRELKQTRKHYIIMLALFLLVLAFMLLPLFISLAYGGAADGGRADINGEILFCAAPLALLGGIAAGTNNGLQKADISAGWKRYSFVLPPTAVQQAVSDLSVKICHILLFGAVTAVYPLLMYCMTGADSVSPTFNLYFGAAAAAVLTDAAYCYIIMFAKTKKDLAIIGAAAFLGAGLILRVADFFTGDINIPAQSAAGRSLISEEALNELVAATGSTMTTVCVLAAFVTACVLYFLVMWRSHERREP